MPNTCRSLRNSSKEFVIFDYDTKNWLDRIADEKDRRANYLRLTPKGVARWKKAPNFIQALQKEMMAGITKEEEANALTALKKVWTNLSEEESVKD